LAKVKKIQLEQLQKHAQREARSLLQRAADLESKAAKDVARLHQEMEEDDE
jgi:hypothetical protein